MLRKTNISLKIQKQKISDVTVSDSRFNKEKLFDVSNGNFYRINQKKNYATKPIQLFTIASQKPICG